MWQSIESATPAQTFWLIHMNILRHKHGWESKSAFSLPHMGHSVLCVCLVRNRLKLSVLALGRTCGRRRVTDCWQIRILSAMQAPVKQATLMSQKNNWRLPPAICCPYFLSIRVASIVSAPIRAWRAVENTVFSHCLYLFFLCLPLFLALHCCSETLACSRPAAHLFPKGRGYCEKTQNGLFLVVRVSCEHGRDAVDVVVVRGTVSRAERDRG